MTIIDIILQLIMAFLGTLGFSLLFNIRASLLAQTSIGGLLGWVIFLVVENYYGSIYIASFLASAFVALYGEVMARIFKTPANVFFIPGVVPLIPGRALFNTCRFALQSDWLMFKDYGSVTLKYALGIACGLSISWALWYMLLKIFQLSKHSKL